MADSINLISRDGNIVRRKNRKPEHYRIRDEIEKIIKEDNICRSKFHEVSKYSYEKIIRKFYYSFFDYDKNIRYLQPKKIELSYAWLNFRKNLKQSEIIPMHYDYRDIESIKNLIPDYYDGKLCFAILADGWVYEGEISEIIKVLTQVSIITDYYIISKKFDWVVVNCEDGESLCRIDS